MSANPALVAKRRVTDPAISVPSVPSRLLDPPINWRDYVPAPLAPVSRPDDGQEGEGWGSAIARAATRIGAGFVKRRLNDEARKPKMPKPTPLPLTPSAASIALPMPTPDSYYRRGGNWSKDIGRPVVVGEDGPEIVVPTAPAIVVPAPQTDMMMRTGEQSVRPGRALLQQAIETIAQAKANADAQAQAEGRPSDIGDVYSAAAQHLAPEQPTPPISVPLAPPYVAPAVPMTGKVRRAPAPGEEEAQTAIMAQRLAQYPELAGEAQGGIRVPSPPEGVRYAPLEVHDRRRFADPVGRVEDQLDYELQNPASDRNGGLKSTLKNAGIGFLQGFGRGGLGGGVGGAVAGAIIGGVDHGYDERLEQEQRVANLRGQYQDFAGRRKTDLGLQEQQQAVRLRGAQADYQIARPAIEAAKTETKALKDRRTVALRTLGMLKGQRLDVSNPEHAALISELRDAGVVGIDPDSWNDAKGNIIRVTETDETDPTRTVDVAYNVATGERTIIGQKGFQTPVHSDTEMTAPQEAANEDRDAARENTERNRAQLLGLSTARLRETLANGLVGRAQKRFNVTTQSLFTEHGRLETQIAALRSRAAKKEISPAEAERRISELEKRRDKLTTRIESARSDALGDMQAAPSRSSAAPATGYAGKRISRSNLPEAAKRLGVSIEEAERRIKAGGGVIY